MSDINNEKYYELNRNGRNNQIESDNGNAMGCIEFDRKLECLLPGGVLREEPMAKHTTFRIGGPAEWYVCPPVELLPQVIALADEAGVPVTVIGNGSNLLVADAGIRGIVIEIGKAADSVLIENNDESVKCTENTVRVRIGAGTLLSKAARVAADAGLSGMEFAAGIPGSLGGAVVMNAGAYGGQMADILTEVTVLERNGQCLIFSRGAGRETYNEKPGQEVCDTELGQGASAAGQNLCMQREHRVEYRNFEELDLSYRHSVVPERGYIVVEAVVELSPAPKEIIFQKMAELRQKRIDKQPLEYPSAGSTFKRPEGYFAGKLIEDAGLKGYTVGGAQVSVKHSGFVINTGGATASDVRQLISDVQERVMQQFGVYLEPEVKMAGDFA